MPGRCVSTTPLGSRRRQRAPPGHGGQRTAPSAVRQRTLPPASSTPYRCPSWQPTTASPGTSDGLMLTPENTGSLDSMIVQIGMPVSTQCARIRPSAPATTSTRGPTPPAANETQPPVSSRLTRVPGQPRPGRPGQYERDGMTAGRRRGRARAHQLPRPAGRERGSRRPAPRARQTTGSGGSTSPAHTAPRTQDGASACFVRWREQVQATPGDREEGWREGAEGCGGQGGRIY